jgi:hypothetical protein
MDIAVANSSAKSLLRAVAQEWAMTHSNVDYFPSYEIVQNSDRSAVWEAETLKRSSGAANYGVVSAKLHRVSSK